MNKLLIYIVSYQRKSFTQGTIECLNKVKPANSQIIVCDNGSTDGTREWLELNQEKYKLGLIFPEENLRVPGAWKLLTQYYSENDFDYILPLDNDYWVLPDETWFSQCLEVFNSDVKIGSLGLQRERKVGYFCRGKTLDPNFKDKIIFNNLEIYDTVFYAGARLDKFQLWYKTMKDWPHKFIGDKIGNHYNSLGYRTVKINPGVIIDISEYNFDNKEHVDYNIDFYKNERDNQEYERTLNMHSSSDDGRQFISDNFGENFLKYL
tara:strand:+ start:1299 stop:2090 length:792 start_codon:yes stop_codon:yes gene_type:complete